MSCCAFWVAGLKAWGLPSVSLPGCMLRVQKDVTRLPIRIYTQPSRRVKHLQGTTEPGATHAHARGPGFKIASGDSQMPRSRGVKTQTRFQMKCVDLLDRHMWRRWSHGSCARFPDRTSHHAPPFSSA